MRQVDTRIKVETEGEGLFEITDSVADWVRLEGIQQGLLTVFVAHTSCSLTIQENADPAVQRDLLTFFRRLVPEGPIYEHSAEGPDDMPAHIKAAMMPVSLSIPVINGQLALGTWQGIYLFEHRDRPHSRSVVAHLSR